MDHLQAKTDLQGKLCFAMLFLNDKIIHLIIDYQHFNLNNHAIKLFFIVINLTKPKKALNLQPNF